MTTAQRRLYAVALVALPLLSVLEERLTHVAQGGAQQVDGKVGSVQMLEPITAHHGLWLAGAFVAMLFAVLQLPAFLAMIGLARPRAGRLTAVGGVLALIGVVLYGGYVVTWNFVIGAMAGAGAASSEMVRLAGSVEHYPPFLLVFANAYPMNIGLLLLAVALGRSRMVPWWAAVCMAVGPLNELVGTGGGWVYILADAVWLVGLARVALAVLRPGARPPVEEGATRDGAAGTVIPGALAAVGPT